MTAAEALDVEGVGVMLTDAGGNRFVHATTTPATELELIQDSLQIGPCRDARLSGKAIVAVDSFDRWPEFATVAREVGISVLAAIPLMSRGRCWGVLDLYRSGSRAWDALELQQAELLADVATSHLVVAADRDASRRTQSLLAHANTHDLLTGLPNRSVIFDRLDQALATASRRSEGVGVLFIDLDDFKGANDRHGHRNGDVVLVEVAARLSRELRGGDTLGRLSGDEFIWICALSTGDPGQHADELLQVSTRVHSVLAPAVALPGDQIMMTASVGAVHTGGRGSAEAVVDEADAAMYRAKRRGRGLTEVHLLGESRIVARGQYAFERHLADALERDQLVVHYQPIKTSGPNHRTIAVEALLRCRDANDELMPAARFIETAGQLGLMPTFGSWVINQACAQMHVWKAELGDAAPEVTYVNLSAAEINNPALPDVLASAVQRHGIEARNIGLEIVEDNFSNAGMVAVLERLRAAGHQLSIDDFGTGYSSLSRLFALRVDIAKIDQAFVSGMAEDPRRAGFVNAVLAIAQALGIAVVAEGVETIDDQLLLSRAGCPMLQGYLLGRPTHADLLTAAIRAETILPETV